MNKIDDLRLAVLIVWIEKIFNKYTVSKVG